MRRFRLVVCAALLALACRERSSPSPSPDPPATAASAPSRAPVVLTPKLMEEVERAGLRVKSGTVDRESRWGFSDLGVDLAKIRLEIALAPGGAPLSRLLPAGALAVVNGGYFEANFAPSTWLRYDGRDLGAKSDTSKGGLLAVAPEGDVYVGPFADLRFEPALALQSFPLIVEADGRPGIRSDDGRRAARSVVCWVGRELHFIVIAAPRGDGPTLFESMELLRQPWPRGFGCRAALNLDGGPSSGVWFAPDVGARQRAPSAPVAYGVALLPR